MKQGKRNIVFVGFDQEELEKLEFKDIRESKEHWNNNDFTHRFPRLVYLDTLEQAKRHQGLILFLKMEEEFDFVEYDRKNRKKFKNYEYVFLVVKEKSNIQSFYQVVNLAHILNQYSKIAIIQFFHLRYHPSIHIVLEYIYKQTLQNSKKTLSRIRLENVEKLKTYTQNNKYIDIKKSAFELQVSTKWIKRYLMDMNLIYHNVGYDKQEQQFYVTK